MFGKKTPARSASVCSALILGICLQARAAEEVPPEDITDELVISAQHLREIRSNLQTQVGATSYSLTEQAILNQPGGADVPLNQTLLQAPGVSQDSYGQIHLRNDHANIQYRIDGVILPEGISMFGQSLSTRLAASMDLITGSLPAQYGLNTAGIIDIQTKSGAYKPGGSVGFYGGSHGWAEPSIEYAGTSGHYSYYVSGDLTRNDIGIESPTPASHPLHDTTRQAHGFAMLDDIIDSDDKLSLILGYFQGSFQIPDNPGQTPQFQYLNRTAFDSAALNEHQLEGSDYGVLSYLHAGDKLDYQISAFERYSRLAYSPDGVGDLMFYGLTQTALRQDLAEGLQTDATYRAFDAHTIRFGGELLVEKALANTDSQVFPCFAADCSSVGTTPQSLADKGSKLGTTYSLYLQDEWKLTPEVTVNYGLRYDILNGYTDTDQLSPRVNMVWKPDADTALHAGYSRYFTPPALELISGQSIAKYAYTTGYPSGYTPLNPPANDAILPERSNYFDVGAQRTVLPGLRLGVDAYAKFAKDLIDEGQFGAPIILAVFNYGHANVFGTEFSANYDRDNWSIYSNLSVGREKATNIVSQQFNFTPDDLAFIAKNYIYTDHNQWYSVSGGVSYNWDGTKLNADLVYGTGLRQSVNGIPNGSTVAPYAQINLGANRRFDDVFGQPIELAVNLLNLTDRDYILRSGSGVGVFAPQYGPRRAIYSSIRWFF
jgi:outer membrane receptor protein involved in Fe transport